MAWLETPPSGNIHIGFRIGDEKFRRSLRTKSQLEAKSRHARIEENIRLVEAGRLVIPEDADVITFLLSDGILTQEIKIPKRTQIGKLYPKYVECLPEDSMGKKSLYTAGFQALRIAINGIYSDTLLKVLKGTRKKIVKSQLPTAAQDFLKSSEKVEKRIIAVGQKSQLRSVKNGIKDGIRGGKKKTDRIDRLINQYIKTSEQPLDAQGLAGYINGLETDFQQGVDKAIGIGNQLSAALDLTIFDS